MTDLASALADTSKLDDFEGVPVLRTQVAITNAGDGLSEALAIEPHALPLGVTVYVVLECRVQRIGHVPTNKDDPTEGLARVHSLRAGRATLVERGVVEQALAEQADRIRVAREQAAGIERLPMDDDGQPVHVPAEEWTDEDGNPNDDQPADELEGRRPKGRRR